MDLETKLTDAYTYTLNEIEKNLVLAETHAKQFESDPYFCSECLRKHIVAIEGLADEGVNFTDNTSEKIKFQKISQIMRLFKSKLPELNDQIAFEMADKLRIIRKSLHSSPIILETVASNPIVKDLNTQNKLNNIKRGRKIMEGFKEIGIITGSQLVGRGIQEVSAGYLTTPVFGTVTQKNLVGIVGGLALALVSFHRSVPTGLKTPLAIIGTKLLADEIVDLGKTMVPAAPAYVPRFAPAFAPRYVPTPTAGLVKVD